MQRAVEVDCRAAEDPTACAVVPPAQNVRLMAANEILSLQSAPRLIQRGQPNAAAVRPFPTCRGMVTRFAGSGVISGRIGFSAATTVPTSPRNTARPFAALYDETINPPVEPLAITLGRVILAGQDAENGGTTCPTSLPPSPIFLRRLRQFAATDRQPAPTASPRPSCSAGATSRHSSSTPPTSRPNCRRSTRTFAGRS